MKMVSAYKRSQNRKEKRKFNSIIELIEIFSKDYLKTHSTIEIQSPFGSALITIGKFDNSGKRPLQLKLSSSGGTNDKSAYPGTTSKGDAWLTYETWAYYLDQIDSIDRDYLISGDLGYFSIKKASQIQNHDDFEKLIAKIDEINEHLVKSKEDGEEDNNANKQLKKLTNIVQELQKNGTLKKRLAEILVKCLSWTPNEESINYKKIEKIPYILSEQIAKMQKELSLEVLQPEQARAADSLFFVAVCENFRIPGSLKYMRSCLRHLIDKNLTFQQLFHSDPEQTICTLSPAGGTKVTRECLEKGDLGKLKDIQKEPYNTFSDSSESEDDTKAVNIAYRKK